MQMHLALQLEPIGEDTARKIPVQKWKIQQISKAEKKNVNVTRGNVCFWLKYKPIFSTGFIIWDGKIWAQMHDGEGSTRQGNWREPAFCCS